MTHSSVEIAASRALFARVSRKAAPVIMPISASAADPRGEGPALFCIHSIVGAGVTDFVALARHLASVRTFGVQAPLQRMEDPGFGASVHDLADSYAGAIVETQPSGPIVVAGWSAGAAIALEVAHSLRARGREVPLLVAIDGAPEIADAALRPWDPRYWIGVALNLPSWLIAGQGMDKPATTLLRRVRSLLRRAGRIAGRRAPGAEPRVQPGLERLVSLDRYPPAQRQFMVRLYDAIMGYAPRPWDGPVAVYEARAVLSLPQYLQRWRSVAPQAERILLDGNHIAIMNEPRVGNLARDLEARIAKAATAQAGLPAHRP